MTKTLKFTAIPAWAVPAKADRFTLFEAFALLGLEGQWVRLSADDQRSLLGFAVFGKQQFRVLEDGTVEVLRVTCFGTDSELAQYTARWIKAAADLCKRVSPGTFGPNYLSAMPAGY